MAVFLRISAVLVGLSNWYVSVWDRSFAKLSGVEWLEPILTLVVAVVSGLAVAELLLRSMRRYLEGRFPARYTVGVIGMCLGGTLTGALFALVYAMYANGTADAYNSYGALPFLAAWIGGGLAAGLLGGAVGAVLGVVEGLVFALPLALVLGSFRSAS